MKKVIITLASLFVVFVLKGYCQSLADLDRDPSFKGITIGAPISKYSNILHFSHVSNGKNVYKVTDSYYLSIFNERMQEMIVVESDGKVYAILLSKNMSPDSNMTGSPSVCGMRWKTNTVVLDIVYLFYGTAGSERPKLQYSLYQRKDDY